MPYNADCWQHVPLSDEAAAYVAEVLMQLALDFEATHLGQIRRHHESMRPEPEGDPGQLELFPEHSSSPFAHRPEF